MHNHTQLNHRTIPLTNGETILQCECGHLVGLDLLQFILNALAFTLALFVVFIKTN